MKEEQEGDGRYPAGVGRNCVPTHSNVPDRNVSCYIIYTRLQRLVAKWTHTHTHIHTDTLDIVCIINVSFSSFAIRINHHAAVHHKWPQRPSPSFLSFHVSCISRKETLIQIHFCDCWAKLFLFLLHTQALKMWRGEKLQRIDVERVQCRQHNKYQHIKEHKIRQIDEKRGVIGVII